MLDIHTGTVIHGTLRTQDLLRALAGELDRLNRYSGLAWEARSWAEVIDNEDDPASYEAGLRFEEASAVLDRLFDVLNELAPTGMYFGNTEGDGSDFGWWSIENEE